MTLCLLKCRQLFGDELGLPAFCSPCDGTLALSPRTRARPTRAFAAPSARRPVMMAWVVGVPCPAPRLGAHSRAEPAQVEIAIGSA